jgi:signal transduction histidine kinase
VRARLLGVVLSLVVLVVVGMGVPLAASMASSEQRQLFLDRLTDTSWFASLAQRPLLDDQPWLLASELRRYDDVYGIAVAVFDRDGQIVAASRDGVDVASTPVRDSVNRALAGRFPEAGSLLLPWDDKPLVLAEPVLVDGEVRGAAVTVSPTGRSRTQVLEGWGVLVLGAALALGLAVMFALPVVRWTLRPVRRLDDATGELLAAVVSGRKAEPVGAGGGPPELRKLSRSFDQMATQVGEVLAAQRAFVADASHQLRNPLTALRLRLGNLEGHVDDEAEPHQEAAVAETDRLNQILDELLAMARAEASSVDPVPVDVDRVVSDRLGAWQVAATARGVGLVLAGERGGTALAPPRALETTLDALLDNALKFTGDDTLVEVDVRRRDGWVRLAVRDHGPGLRPEELERATDRFWRSQTHQNVGGSGLGLAIVRQVVERVGGSVALDLPDGGGLRVVVTLPVAADGEVRR